MSIEKTIQQVVRPLSLEVFAHERIDINPYEGYEHYEDLIYFDGPLAYVLKHKVTGQFMYCHWVDYCYRNIPGAYREIFFPVELAEVEKVKANKISLRDFILMHTNESVKMIEFSQDECHLLIANKKDLPLDYLPVADAYLNFKEDMN